MSLRHRFAVTLLGFATFSASSTAAEEASSPEAVDGAATPWETRPSKLSAGVGYPHVLHISYGYAFLPSLRVSASFVGLPPLMFGGGLQADYLVLNGRFGKQGFVTLGAGLQALLLKYNFGIVGIRPNDIDWGVGPELALDVGYAWFSAGIGVGALVGDWRSLKRDIGPDVTPSENIAIAFSLPRLSISW